MELFRKKLFAHGEYCVEAFSRLCEKGCSEQHLSDLLFAISTLTKPERGGLLDPDDLSADHLRRLRRDLISLADAVDRVNKTALNPKFDLLLAPPDEERDPVRKHAARLYDLLPGIMQLYSVHLGRFSKFSKAICKRMTVGQYCTLQLLLYVEGRTGSPRYEEISKLLTAGFLVAGGAEDKIPTFLSAEALAKLKQRTAKFRLTSRFFKVAAPPMR